MFLIYQPTELEKPICAFNQTKKSENMTYLLAMPFSFDLLKSLEMAFFGQLQLG